MDLTIECLQSENYPIRDLTFSEELGAEIRNKILISSGIAIYNCLKESSFNCVLTIGSSLAALGYAVSRSTRLSNLAIKSSMVAAATFGCSVIYSIVSVIFHYYSSNLEKSARKRTFNELRDIPNTMEKQIAAIKEFIELRCPYLGQSYQNHSLHRAITEITLSVKHDEKISLTWGKFLDRINGMQIYLPDKTKYILDFSIEQERLKDREYTIKTEILDPDHPQFIEDLRRISTISLECFGDPLHVGDYLTWLAVLAKKIIEFNYPGCGGLSLINQAWPIFSFVIARDTASNKILGFIHYIPDNAEKTNRFYLASVGRDPGAVRMGIGKLMFDHLINCFPTVQIDLDVRKSNKDAIALYSNAGLEVVGVEKDYYDYPTEDCLNMSSIVSRP